MWFTFPKVYKRLSSIERQHIVIVCTCTSARCIPHLSSLPHNNLDELLRWTVCNLMNIAFQIEMRLLSHTLGIEIRAFRMIQFGQSDFMTTYSETPGLPHVNIISEDDRHYNIIVK